MSLVTCPTCGAIINAFELPRQGLRSRCGACGSALSPDEVAPTREGQCDQDNDRPRRHKRRKRSGRRGLLIGLLVAGIVLLTVGVVVAVVLLGGGGSNRGLLPALGWNPNLTDANVQKLRPGLTPEQVGDILGPGTACDAAEINRVCQVSFDAHHQGEGAFVVFLGEKACAVQSWQRWQSGGLHVFAGYHKSKTGGDRLVFAKWLHQKGVEFWYGDQVILHDHLHGDLDELGRRNEQPKP
jgi:hypothetical protein